MLGNGDRSFAPASSLTLPVLQDVHAIDWPSGGTQELIALDLLRAPMLLSELAADPVGASFPVDEFSATDLDAIHVSDFNQDGQHEVILRKGCRISYQSMAGEVAHVSVSWSLSCDSHVVRFGVGAEQHLLLIRQEASTGMHMLSGYGKHAQTTRISGSVSDLAGVAGLGVVVTGPTGTRLLVPGGVDSIDCISNLNALPYTPARVIAGDFTDNPGHEFVLLGEGQMSLWARP